MSKVNVYKKSNVNLRDGIDWAVDSAGPIYVSGILLRFLPIGNPGDLVIIVGDTIVVIKMADSK